jgi:hypothetical protein
LASLDVKLETPPIGRKEPGRPLLYAATIFTGAFLLFQIQPMIAKAILPWFGGTAAVWTTCMLFFQSALLLGYLYAHSVVRHLSPRPQAALHAGLLAASLVVLPAVPSDAWKPLGADHPTLRILGLLAVTIGLPYLMLSSTSPLLQAWHGRNRPGLGAYRLFALSNLASMLALISYPALIEPRLGLQQQAHLWSVCYAGYAVLGIASALRSARVPGWLEGSGASVSAEEPPRPGRAVRLLWLGLAACGSTLLLAFTNHLSLNVAPIPFLWVLPLSVYLLSFIFCFEREGWYRRSVFVPLTAVSLVWLALQTYGDLEDRGVKVMVPLLAGVLFACCMSCHGELARLKPPTRYLTSFYLHVSLGGALGGVFVGVAAPYLFPSEYELPIGMVACAALVSLALYRDLDTPPFQGARRRAALAGLAGLTLCYAGYLAIKIHLERLEYHLMARSFYGSLRVSDWGNPGDGSHARQLTHGSINHGEQWLHPERRREPTTYYGPDSGMALAVLHGGRGGPQRVGVVGMGAGVILTHARIGDHYRIYEINPLVLQVARTQFSFLEDCPATVEVVLGDARLSLEREPGQQFDVLVVDAFSSDSIPVHLLTREAFEIYFRHLKDTGLLAMHISNLYLGLEPVVEGAARAMGKHALLIDAEEADGYYGSTVVLVASRSELLQQPELLRASTAFPAGRPLRPWTDDYSNLFEVLK